jgi:hypothetical protein
MTNFVAKRHLLSGLALATVLTAISLAPRTAVAVPIVGYSLQISEGIVSGGGGPLMQSALVLAARDAPLFTLVNTSSEAQITQFSVTIGDTNYNFDAVTFNAMAGGPQVTSFSPDSGQGGADAEVATLNFANFNPNSAFSFRTDIDPDNGNALANFRNVFGGATLAQITVSFSDGSVLTDVLSSLAGGMGSVYHCAGLAPLPPAGQQQQATPVPEPAAFTLALLGAAGIAFAFGWRKRRHAEHS